jgi:hypothetical protein
LWPTAWASTPSTWCAWTRRARGCSSSSGLLGACAVYGLRVDGGWACCRGSWREGLSRAWRWPGTWRPELQCIPEQLASQLLFFITISSFVVIFIAGSMRCDARHLAARHTQVGTLHSSDCDDQASTYQTLCVCTMVLAKCVYFLDPAVIIPGWEVVSFHWHQSRPSHPSTAPSTHSSRDQQPERQ